MIRTPRSRTQAICAFGRVLPIFAMRWRNLDPRNTGRRRYTPTAPRPPAYDYTVRDPRSLLGAAEKSHAEDAPLIRERHSAAPLPVNFPSGASRAFSAQIVVFRGDSNPSRGHVRRDALRQKRR